MLLIPQKCSNFVVIYLLSTLKYTFPLKASKDSITLIISGITSLIITLMFSVTLSAQSKHPKKHNHPSGKMNAVSAGILFPLGDFSSTHFIGVGAQYAWSNYRFGRMDVKPVRPVGFIANGGLAYYFGKKEMPGGYAYKYPGYVFLYLNGGVIYNPSNKGTIDLTAGPALGIYNGNNRFSISGKLEGVYYIKEGIGFSPSIMLMKEDGANAIWATSIKAVYCF